MARQELFRHQAVVSVRRRGALSARLATLTRRRRSDVVATVRSGAFAAQLKYARSTVGTDRAASRRVLTDARPAWHAPAMLAGTVGGTVIGRSDLIACSPPYVAGCEYRLVKATGSRKDGRSAGDGTFTARLLARSPDGGRLGSTALSGIQR